MLKNFAAVFGGLPPDVRRRVVLLYVVWRC